MLNLNTSGILHEYNGLILEGLSGRLKSKRIRKEGEGHGKSMG